MKWILSIAVILSIVGCSKEMKIEHIKIENNNTFQDIWNTVSLEPLDKLPQNKVSFIKLIFDDNNNIKHNAQRTLNDHRDIIEPFDKLAHPNGICFKGIWNIDTNNIYSGYFKKDSQALMIARASTALSATTSDNLRAFGFAGKLFPTMNTNKINTEHSANFFLIDDLGGTNATHYTDVKLTNEPTVSFTMAVAQNLLYAIKVAYTFEKADKHSGIRQLYEISQLGEQNKTNIITPKWMKLEAKSINKITKKDFREELTIHQGNNLIFNIFVANKLIDKKKNWKQIGTITLDTSVVSNACDHQLHFHHPKFRNDLKYR